MSPIKSISFELYCLLTFYSINMVVLHALYMIIKEGNDYHKRT